MEKPPINSYCTTKPIIEYFTAFEYRQPKSELEYQRMCGKMLFSNISSLDSNKSGDTNSRLRKLTELMNANLRCLSLRNSQIFLLTF